MPRPESRGYRTKIGRAETVKDPRAEPLGKSAPKRGQLHRLLTVAIIPQHLRQQVPSLKPQPNTPVVAAARVGVGVAAGAAGHSGGRTRLPLSSTNTGSCCPHSQDGRAGIQNGEMQKQTLNVEEGGEENPQD